MIPDHMCTFAATLAIHVKKKIYFLKEHGLRIVFFSSQSITKLHLLEQGGSLQMITTEYKGEGVSATAILQKKVMINKT